MARKNRAIFLDRDGTLTADPRYLDDPNYLILLPYVGEALHCLQKAGFKLIVITNQSGIGRGFFTHETLKKIHKKLRDLLREYNVFLTDIYYCPHHPDDKCACRKPGTFLLKKAAQEHNIDLSKSFVIGDDQCDIDMAQKADCRAILVGERSIKWDGPRMQDMLKAADMILSQESVF